ncbi:DUF3732 domain-containing protein [uncultured Pseudoalteromonas sp.]|uniref:DUF3732 domain-containing protein n=1 Tax=uncultured Pseudoalteromonas sp. TaxID=114053 RepID=UPI000C58FCB8|nr:DUF3732 domain-containing protein [uncultured Pseudoalteromonas sp.]MBD56884.1 hypothetical protein [Pseudoalteromonas sp.]|tara:strand:+ start:4128 stop:6035 length:1908 start_codon:yes stop_codon:yes gene_type:complete
MNSYIKKIIIFSAKGEQRELTLTKGLNIISGHSKKGKSALIEIVDYCLCSTVPSIPKGIISDFASLFCIVMKVESNYLVIARPNDETQRTKVYVSLETDKSFLKSFNIRYFDDKPLLKIKGAGQENIEKFLGLNVLDSNLDDSDRKKGKASLRNMTPFLYQYQNLIASKHALFSKMDDYSKKTSIIEQIPIFLGIVDAEYYSLRRQIDDIEKQLKAIDREKQKEKTFNLQYQSRLEGLCRNYFSIVGKELPEFHNVNDLIVITKELPTFDQAEPFKSDASRLYSNLRSQLSTKTLELNSVNAELTKIESVSKRAKKTISHLSKLKGRVEHVEDASCHCPICGSDVKSLSEEASLINTALDSLNSEVGSMAGFARFDSEQVETLKQSKREIQKVISELTAQINDLESYNAKVKEYKDKRDSLGYLRAKIEVVAEQISNRIQVSDYGENELAEELNSLKKRIQKYDFESDLVDCQSKLNGWANSIANALDFEQQFLPAKLNINLRDLSIFHNDKKYGKLRLSDFGSGANWLAFHLAASISFLRLFSYKKNSPVPNFLFIDQPSQVYFPRDFSSHNDDIKKVENIYIQIIKSLKEARKTSGSYSQVIVLDHADNLDLKDYKYERYVRAKWFDEEDALI